MSVQLGKFKHRRGLALHREFIKHFLLVGVKSALPDGVRFVVKTVERLAFAGGGGQQAKCVIRIALGLGQRRQTFVAADFQAPSTRFSD